ncbi:MAG: hypothetical protein WCS45_02495 [Clostridia bacterium]|jgi:DNA polymerase III delta subunit
MHAKDLKNGVLGRVFFLKGDDLYWLDYAREFFIKLTDKENRDVSVKIFDEIDSLADIIFTVSSFSFTGGNHIIIVKDSKYKAKKDELRVFRQTIQGDIDPYFLVLENVSFLEKEDKELVTEIDCGKLKKFDLLPIVEDIFAPHGGIDRDAALTLIDYTAGDMAKIDLETKKIIAYADGQRVDLKTVEALASEDSELQIFEFVNNFVEGRRDKALKLLDKLLTKGESKNYILGALIRQYRRMLHSTLSPKSDAEVAKLLNVREYAIKKARQIKNLNKIKMKSILDMLVDYEYKFKSGSMSLDLAFDCAISNIMQI